MKNFISRSLSVVLPILLLLLTACKPEYAIETVVEFEDQTSNYVEEKAATLDLLQQRLVDDYGQGTTLTATPDGIKILTRHRDQPLAEMGQLIGYLGSAELAFYDIFRAAELLGDPVLDSLVWQDYKAERNGGFMGESVIAGVEKFGQLPELLADLNGSDKQRKGIRYLSGPNKSAQPNRPGDIHHLVYAIKVPRSGEARLTNSSITEATAGASEYTGEIEVELTMNIEGSRVWADMTTKAAADNNRQMAMVINDEVISAPSVRTPITGGRTVISGGFSVEEAQTLARQLLWEPLPLKLKVVSQNVVD